MVHAALSTNTCPGWHSIVKDLADKSMLERRTGSLGLSEPRMICVHVGV